MKKNSKPTVNKAMKQIRELPQDELVPRLSPVRHAVTPA